MDHPNIVKAHEVYYEKTQIFLILEYCDGGDLYSGMPYSEKRAQELSKQLISAIKYMHDNGIVHRDLKFENIMFESKHSNATIKVIDFGLSRKFRCSETVVMGEAVGAIYAMAPEMFRESFTSQADLWSAGVIVYMLISSKKPFEGRIPRDMIDPILKGEYSIDGPIWGSISDDAKDMVQKLLVVDPEVRLDATMALKHQWLYNENLTDKITHNETELEQIGDGLWKYRNASSLKRIALNMIAHKSSSEEIFKLRQWFDEIDSSNDGIITFEELKKCLEDLNYSDETIEEIFESIDLNENGHIMYTEFLAATLEVQSQIEEERIAEAFYDLDENDDNYISKEELSRVLGSDNASSKQMVNTIIAEADLNNDGKIGFQEFRTAFRKQTSINARRLYEF